MKSDQQSIKEVQDSIPTEYVLGDFTNLLKELVASLRQANNNAKDLLKAIK